MGLFGNKGRDRELQRIGDEMRRHLERGDPTFIVSVDLLANGVGMASAQRMRQDAIAHVERSGGTVTGIQVEDWAHRAHLQVQARVVAPVPTPAAPRPPAPAGAVGYAPSAMPAGPMPDSHDPDQLDGWYRAALRPWSAPETRGRTLARGYGFEDAMAVVVRPSPGPPIFQGLAQRAAELVISDVRSGVSLDEYDEVLGMSVAQLRRLGLDERAMEELSSELDASKDALLGLGTMDADRLREWTSSHRTRQKVFVLHAAYLGRTGRYG